VKAPRSPFGSSSHGSIFLLLDPQAEESRRARLLAWLSAALPRFNWRSHLHVLHEGESPRGLEAAEEVARIAAEHLERHELAILHLHLAVGLPSGELGGPPEWERLVGPARPFQTRAYREGGEARLLIHPTLTVPPWASAESVREAAAFFRSRFAAPAFVCRDAPPEGLAGQADREGLRLHVLAGREPGLELAGELWASHVFESALERLDQPGGDLLAPCRSHLVVDERSGVVSPCFLQWREGGPPVFFGHDAGPVPELPGPPPADPCPACAARCALSMKDSLVANARQREDRRVGCERGRARAGAGEHARAAELARRACELSTTERDRAAAWIHEGLCRLELGELEAAEEALEQAVGSSDDPGLLAHHRGRVLFARRDYITALDRFEEALSSGSELVPAADTLLQMAICHLNIEEYSEARDLLERHQSLEPVGEEASVRFYLGLCELGEGRPEPALSQFRAALLIGPAEEDRGRVLFYQGTCLKELGRFEEAIEALELAVEADPEELAGHNLLGFCYYSIKRHDEAVECFRRAVEIDPRSGIDWANLGSNLRELGRIEEAVEMYEKALALDPSIDFARASLNRLYRARQDGEE